ncbi:MAG: S8 family serine peptidase [Tyzzerella sp.]|nr:S8 family serine peptidase [Tyzzerella sp.]
MADQKLENVLNLALDATEEERDKSLELNVGYDPIAREWDLIVKYSGSLDCVRNLGAQVVELQNEFAIVTIREDRIPLLTDCAAVEYVEKPKRLFFQVEEGKRASCITSVQTPPESLSGNGVLVAVIDSGIDYENEVFRNPDGTTRIRNLWDQTIQGNPPEGYVIGTEYTQEEINEALSASPRQERLRIVPSRDISGHGTAVAGILAGNSEDYQGVAYQSEMIVVKLGTPRAEGFPRTTELIQALDYVVRKALEYGMPVAVNISFGNTYGAHDGSSLLELFIEDIANRWKSVICIGTGNEGNTAGHTSGVLREDEEVVIELAVQENSPSLNVQIWKAYFDEVEISLITPSGVRVGPIQEVLGSQRFNVGNTQILLYYGEPSPFSIDQEIFLDFLPRDTYIDSGVWRIVLTPGEIVNGEYALWLPSEGVLNEGTGFLFPTEERTLTIPSTSYRTIGVGAYDSATFSYADFSGRGPAGPGRRAKPDIVAPGVNILAPVPGGTFGSFSGTSFATPFATGGAALLMEWGIVRGNDPFLYGEKVKAYFQRGARAFPGITVYPNPLVGYGALCVENSLP